MITLTNDHELGPVLRRLRHDAGLSLEQLAKRCFITKGGLSNREIRPRAMTAGALIETAGALGFDVVLVRRPRCQEPACPDYGDPDHGQGTCPAEHAQTRAEETP